jgi:hypothetical protein
LAKNYIPIQHKKDGYIWGKTEKLNHPPLPFLGQNVGEKIYIYTKAKRMVISGGKLENYKPPPMCPKI